MKKIKRWIRILEKPEVYLLLHIMSCILDCLLKDRGHWSIFCLSISKHPYMWWDRILFLLEVNLLNIFSLQITLSPSVSWMMRNLFSLCTIVHPSFGTHLTSYIEQAWETLHRRSCQWERERGWWSFWNGSSFEGKTLSSDITPWGEEENWTIFHIFGRSRVLYLSFTKKEPPGRGKSLLKRNPSKVEVVGEFSEGKGTNWKYNYSFEARMTLFLRCLLLMFTKNLQKK